MEDIIRGLVVVAVGCGLRAAVGCITWAQNEFNGMGMQCWLCCLRLLVDLVAVAVACLLFAVALWRHFFGFEKGGMVHLHFQHIGINIEMRWHPYSHLK